MSVDVVGMGAMGTAFVDVLQQVGHAVQGLTRAGLLVAGRRRSQAVVVCVASGADLRRVIHELGEQNGPASLVLWTGTATITDVTAAAASAVRDGMAFLDVPVSGTPEMLRGGNAVLLAGGGAEDVAAARRLLPTTRVEHVGVVGDGTRAKYVANALLAVHTAAAAEAVVIAELLGLKPDRAAFALRGSAASSAAFDLRAHRMAAQEYEPARGPVSGLDRDLVLIAEELRNSGMSAAPPLLGMAAGAFREATTSGLADRDVSAVVEPMRARIIKQAQGEAQ